jgi:ABC-type antimicrobial peptide transport system permease subunit
VFQAVQAGFFSVRGATLAEGRFFGVGEHTADVAVIGAQVRLDFGWHVGDVISYPGVRNKYTVIGELEPVESTASLSDRAFGYGMDDLIFVPFDNPATADPSVYMDPKDTEYFNRTIGYWVKVRPGMQAAGIEQVRDCLNSLAPEGAWAWVTPRPMNSAIKIAGENFAASFGTLTGAIYAVSAVAFSSVFLARVTSRAKEIGIRRAIGMSGRRAAAEVAAEALMISILGTGLATLAFFITHRLFGIAWSPSTFPTDRFVSLIVPSVLLGPIGVIGPAEVAARVSPMSSIRDELGWGSQRRRIDLRQAFALASLGLAVATVCFASSLGLSTVNGVDRQLRACGVHDVEVSSVIESPAEVGQLQYTQLQAALPAGMPMALVQRSTASTWSPDGAKWDSVTLIGCDGDIGGALGFACSAGRLEQLGEDEVIVGSKLAVPLGGNAAVGRTIMVGPAGRPYRIAGVLTPKPKNVVDRNGDRDKAILLSRAGLSQIASPVDSLARIVIRCANQDSADGAMETATQALGNGYQVSKPFGSLKALRALQVRFTACLFLGSMALSLAVSVAVGIIMIMRMWETRRSMAIQIAVGSTSRQVALSGGIDMLTVTLVATGAGLVLGLAAYAACMVARKLPLQIGLGGALITASLGLMIAGVLGAVCFVFFRGKSVAQYLHD